MESLKPLVRVIDDDDAMRRSWAFLIEGEGWDVAVYSSIEHIYGYDYVTSDYKEKPEASWQKIVSHMNILYSSATEKQIKKILK